MYGTASAYEDKKHMVKKDNKHVKKGKNKSKLVVSKKSRIDGLRGLLSPDTVLLGLRLEGRSQAEIGKLLGVNQKTVSRWLAPWKIDGLEEVKNHRADILELYVNRILDAFGDRIEKMDGKDLSVAFAKFYDRLRLERGKATRIMGYDEMEREHRELEAEREALEKEIAELESKGKVRRLSKGCKRT